MRPSATPSPRGANAASDLVADLVAAGTDAGTDGGRGRSDRFGAGAGDARGEPAPAAVEHREAVRPGERDREAVGDEDEHRRAGAIDRVAVELRRIGLRLGPAGGSPPGVAGGSARAPDAR